MQYTPEERLAAHAVRLPPGYLPQPERHLQNPRDYGVFMHTLKWLESIKAKSVLDIGCYDGWLDFLLIQRGYQVHGVEMIGDLAQAGKNYAEKNGIPDYQVWISPAHEIVFPAACYDAVVCHETLEHMPINIAMECTYRFEQWARSGVLISLPDQDHRENPQHCFTLDNNLYEFWFGGKDAHCVYKEWTGTSIPANYFIDWVPCQKSE